MQMLNIVAMVTMMLAQPSGPVIPTHAVNIDLSDPSTPLPAPMQALSPAPTDPARLAAAEAFLASMDPERTLRRTVDVTASTAVRQMKPQLEGQMGHAMTSIQEDRLTSAMRDDMMTMYQGIWPDMMRGMARAYAAIFTVAELRHITDLMRDPLMLRMIEVMPEVMQRTFADVNFAEPTPRMTRMMAVLSELLPAPTSIPPSRH